ncbi:hypothetical protein LINGRAHAP2_LOCUS32491 [Linum grandiflorum]
MENLLELSDIQPYVINSAQVVFLNERPTKNGGKAIHHVCEVCGRRASWMIAASVLWDVSSQESREMGMQASKLYPRMKTTSTMKMRGINLCWHPRHQLAGCKRRIGRPVRA